MSRVIIFALLCVTTSCATKKEETKVVSFKINKKENVIELKYNNGEVKRMYNNRIV